MIVVAAVDDRYGMMFNKRRQSQDSVLREHFLNMSDGKTVRMNAYTRKQFTETAVEALPWHVEEQFLEVAGQGDICFVENVSVLPYEEQVEKVILYKWNRNYPADVHFDLPLAQHNWKCTMIEEFVGSSHEKITVEEWIR